MALAKPHRVAFLAPEVLVEGGDLAYEREAALLVWTACIELCQRHPNLAVYDFESMPIVPRDGHFVPRDARRGATPSDAFFGPTRRDEVAWLELTLVAGKSGAVRLHTIARDGTKRSFDAVGRKVGDQIDQVFAAWLNARKLGPLPKRFEPVTADEVLTIVRMIAPTLVDRARAPVARTPADWEDPDGEAAAEADDLAGSEAGAGDEPAATMHMGAFALPDVTSESKPISRQARNLSQRLPVVLRVPALRLLSLALDENLDDLILAIDPDHPQALFAKFAVNETKDFALLRRIIAIAPAWAHPYAELVGDEQVSLLETVAGAGMAALCRPGNTEVLGASSAKLVDAGRVTEAVRLVERALAMYDQPETHIALATMLREDERVGARLAIATRASQRHGCPMDAFWYPDQIQTDLALADALLDVGRLDEAIALRANRIPDPKTWPRHTRILESWRRSSRLVAWSYAHEGYHRGDPARTVEGFGRIEPGDSLDLAVFLDALVQLGREAEVPLAWAQFGLGRGFGSPLARLAAVRGLLAAGEWRRGLEELWRVELTEPGRDEHVVLARCGLLLSVMPIDIAEVALGDRVAIGAPTLAKRMARDIADFVPSAATSGLVVRALGGRGTAVAFEPGWLAGFGSDTRSKRAIDALFDRPEATQGDRIVDRWLEVVFGDAGEDDAVGLVQATVYVAAQALARYLAATTAAPNAFAGALRTVASEALELVRTHRDALGDREIRALLGAIDPLIRRVDRWIGIQWLATVERACGIDERSRGDLAAFSTRILGPEELAVLSSSIARLHRERPEGWSAAVATQAERLALHTGFVGVDEWADAVVAQLAERAIDVDDAIDALHTACFLAEGKSAKPALALVHVLLRAGRAPAARDVLATGLSAATPKQRDRELGLLADEWKRAGSDVPLAFDKLSAGVFEALQKGEPARAEKLGRLAVAIDPTNGEAHRNLGLALAQQGKLADALHHLVVATPEQATQILAGVLYQSGKLPEALGVLDYASRWYVRADQWLTYGGIAYAAMDNVRTVKAYNLAYKLDPSAFDATQLNAYAGVLDEVGDYAQCASIAARLEATDDLMWKTCAWNHQACAAIGLGDFARAVTLAERAVAQNPLPDNAAPFATTLERARTKTQTFPASSTTADPTEAIALLIETGDHAGAAAKLGDPSWFVRRLALVASTYRYASENHVTVTTRARAAATAVLADTHDTTDRDAIIARTFALAIREHAYFARDPVPTLGDRMTRDAFYREFRARGGIVLGDDAPPPVAFTDRVAVPGAKVARVSDYIALLRDLAALRPREALAQFDLDEAGYIELSKQWGAAMDADPTLAATIAAGLATAK